MDASSGLLWQCPPVIKNIFKYLGPRDLGSCAKVCSLWNTMSITENNRRRFVHWFLEIGIGQSVGREDCRIPTLSTLYPFQRQMASTWSRPSFCLAFVTTETLRHVADALPRYFQIHWKIPTDPHHQKISLKLQCVRDKFLEPLLPARCLLHCIASRGIIGCHANGFPAEVERGRAISGLLIPNLPGLHIDHCCFEDYHLWFQRPHPRLPVKGMLAFIASPIDKLMPAYINEFVQANGVEEFAVGGAVVEPVLLGLGSIFLFTGENVQVASVVIGRGTTDVAYELELFKKTGMLEHRCFAFMFSCVSKGARKYTVPNFESGIFQKMYPGVPLAGVFGTGEVGTHFLPNVDKEDPDHKQRCRMFPLKKCLRAYCTVFVLVSVKEPN